MTKILKNIENVTVYITYQQKYILKRGNKYSYDCKLIIKDIPWDKPRKYPNSPPKKKLRKSAPSFDFENHCFICGLEADAVKEQKKKSKKRKIVHVKKAHFKELLLIMIAKISDDICKAVLPRISCVDLVAVNAKYHNDCYYTKIKDVYDGRRSTDSCPLGRPPSESIDEAMDKVFDFLDNSNDNQFTMDELINVIGMENNSIINHILKTFGLRYKILFYCF